MSDFINEMKISCSTCRFCVQQECRRFPPILTAFMRDGCPTVYGVGFPAIYDAKETWCGEYQSAQQFTRKEVQ